MYNVSTNLSKETQMKVKKSLKHDILKLKDSNIAGHTEYKSCFKESEGYSRLELKKSLSITQNYE